MTYEEFVRRDGARLRAGLVAAYGPDVSTLRTHIFRAMTKSRSAPEVTADAR